MTHPQSWLGIRDPAHLFLAMWRYVNAMERDRLSSAVEVPLSLRTELADALARRDDASASVDAFCSVLAIHWNGEANFRAGRFRASLVLTALRVIDEVILAIHPRAIVRPARAKTLPAWLDDVREHRTLYGGYAQDDRFSLIARGPFARGAKPPLVASTFDLCDQFFALTVIDLLQFTEDSRPLQVEIKVVDQSADFGVPPRRDRAASEVISFVPLAEAEDDLIPKIIKDDATTFIDILKGTAFDPARRFLDAIKDCTDSDIVIAPELTVDTADVDAIAAGLSAMTGARPRLLVTGSGPCTSIPSSSGFPFNQAVMLNGHGARLWVHRKVSAYGMLEETSKTLDLDGVNGEAQLMERISWSDTVTVADVDGLGRCIVLICQDLMMKVVQRLLEEFRPDWVIVPILDSGTCLKRWPARRARDLAPFSDARFVVVSSLTMKHWQKTKYPGEKMGVAVGPAYTHKGAPDEPPAVWTEIIPDDPTRRHGSIRWRSHSGWQKYR